MATTLDQGDGYDKCLIKYGSSSQLNKRLNAKTIMKWKDMKRKYAVLRSYILMIFEV